MANITSNLEEEYIATTVELRAKACLNTFQVNHVLARHAVKHFFQKKQYFVPLFFKLDLVHQQQNLSLT